MTIKKITASDIEFQIHQVFKEQGGNRKGKKSTLDKASELGRQLLDSLNETSETVHNIEIKIDSFTDEYDKLIEQINDYEADIIDADAEVEIIDSQIEDYETRGVENLDEDEREHLEELYLARGEKSKTSRDASTNIANLQGSIDTCNSNIDSGIATLDETIVVMDDYNEAGGVIKEAAHKYGKKNMNVEKALQRNETSWFNSPWVVVAGAAVTAGTGAIIGFGAAGTTILSTVKIPTVGVDLGGNLIRGVGQMLVSTTSGSLKGALVNGLFGAVAGGIAGGTAHKFMNFGPSKTEKFLSRAGYTALEGSNMSYFDSVDQHYISKFDGVIEAKGGNTIRGGLRRRTASAYSYGQTIQDASQDIKKRAEDAKS